jgi:hypothetical protein
VDNNRAVGCCLVAHRPHLHRWNDGQRGKTCWRETNNAKQLQARGEDSTCYLHLKVKPQARGKDSTCRFKTSLENGLPTGTPPLPVQTPGKNHGRKNAGQETINTDTRRKHEEEGGRRGRRWQAGGRGGGGQRPGKPPPQRQRAPAQEEDMQHCADECAPYRDRGGVWNVYHVKTRLACFARQVSRHLRAFRSVHVSRERSRQRKTGTVHRCVRRLGSCFCPGMNVRAGARVRNCKLGSVSTDGIGKEPHTGIQLPTESPGWQN